MNQKIKFFIAIFLGILQSFAICANEIILLVTDPESGKAVEFYTALSAKRSYSTLADDQGIAHLNSDKILPGDSLLLRNVGYRSLPIAIPKELTSDTLRFTMEREIYEMPEVKIAPPKKSKMLRKGKRHDSGMMVIGFGEPKGICVATEVGKKGRRTWLTDVAIHSIVDSAFIMRQQQWAEKQNLPADSVWHPLEKVRCRINIYDAANMKKYDAIGRVGAENVMHEPIIFAYERAKVVENKFTYTLPEPLLLPEIALVEIELLDDIPFNNTIFFKGNLFGRGTLFKSAEDLDWFKMPIAHPFTFEFIEEQF